MNLKSVLKWLVAATVSLTASISSAQSAEDFVDLIGGIIEAGRNDHGSRHPSRIHGRVVKSMQIKADKLASDSKVVDVWESASFIRLTALKNPVSFRSDFEVVGDSRWPLIYDLYELREGETRILDIRQGRGYPMFVDHLRLHIESPSIIGSRGVLLIELLR